MYSSLKRSGDGNEPDYETMAAQAQAYASTPKPQMSTSQYNSGYGYEYDNYDDYSSGFNNNYYYNQSVPGAGYNQSGSGYNQSGSGYGQTGSGYGYSGSGYDQSESGYSHLVGSEYDQSGSSLKSAVGLGYNQFGSENNYSDSAYSIRSGSGQKRSQPEPPGTEPPPLPPPEDMAPPPLPPHRPTGPPGPPSQGKSSLKRTPLGQKRPYSQLLPDPEPSPEYDYIGQHSQGIGGHYAESYRKRMRLDI